MIQASLDDDIFAVMEREARQTIKEELPPVVKKKSKFGGRKSVMLPPMKPLSFNLQDKQQSQTTNQSELHEETKELRKTDSTVTQQTSFQEKSVQDNIRPDPVKI